MTIPLNNYPVSRPYSNIQPFTVRAGATHMLQIETLLKWIREDLVPHLDGEVGGLADSWATQTLELIENWETLSASLIESVNEKAGEAAADAATAELAKQAAEAARDLAEQFASDAAEVQDGTIAGLLADAESAIRGALAGLYAPLSMQTEIETGRLSVDALDTRFNAKADAEQLTEVNVELAGRLSDDSLRSLRGTVVDSDYDTLAEALEATPLFGILEVRETHVLTEPFVVDRPVTIEFRDNAGLTVSDKEMTAVFVTSPDVTLISPRIVGAGATVKGDGNGIDATGAHRLTIRNMQIHEIPRVGVSVTHVDGLLIEDGFVKRAGYGGVMLQSCRDGVVRNVLSEDMLQPSGYINSYGFAASRFNTEPVSVNHHCENITFDSCIARNVPLWEGFDTHGGINISWINCQAINCDTGFAIVNSPDKTVDPFVWADAPKNCFIKDCTADSTVTDGSRGPGLVVQGYASDGVARDYASATVDGLVIIGHGKVGLTNYGATYIHNTRGLVLSNIRTYDCYNAGIMFYLNNDRFVVNNVACFDTWAYTTEGQKAVGIGFRNVSNVGLLSNVVVATTGKFDSVPNKSTHEHGVRAWMESGRVDCANLSLAGHSVAAVSHPNNNVFVQRMVPTVPFFGAKVQVTGSRGGNVALANLLNALAEQGLIINATT